MRYTEIAGKKVSAMSLGTVQLGLDYGIANREGKPDRQKSFSILSAALEAGVTALDTARAYGDSEEVLGAFLKANPGSRDKLFITTKLLSDVPAGSPASDVEKALALSVETSLSKLGLSKVDCLLLHIADDMTLHGSVVPATLRRFVNQGIADMAGVSVYYPEEAETMMKDDIYTAIQLPMSILDQRFIESGAIEWLRGRGVKIFVRSVFFQGLLFLDPKSITDPGLLRFAAPHLKTLRRLSDKAGMSIAQLALTFLRDMPGITSLVLGAENPAQVMENSALFEAPSLPDSLRHEAEEAFKDVDYEGIMTVLRKPRSLQT